MTARGSLHGLFAPRPTWDFLLRVLHPPHSPGRFAPLRCKRCPPLLFSYWQLFVWTVSCRAPVLPKMVILTSSSRLASLSLKSVTLDDSTVKILRSPSIFEKVSPLDNRVTSFGAAAGAFCFCRYSTHLRCR